MTFEIIFVLGVLAAMTYLFLSERLPVEVTGFLALLALLLAGLLRPEELFVGFSSPAVITILAGFFISAALQHTGVADAVGGRLQAVAGAREVPLTALLMAVTALLSSIMPNVAATAVMMPTVSGVSRQTGVPASRLFMPLAFAAILGGTLTQIGTPPNLVASEVLADRGIESFTLFSFSAVGLGLVGLGVLFMVTLGLRWLPRHAPSGPPTGADLTRIYQISDRVFSVRVPPDSPLEGVTLQDARIGTALGINVLAIHRDGKRVLAPSPDADIHGGDVLLVEGTYNDLRELLRLRGLEMTDALPWPDLREAAGLFTGVVLRIGKDSSLAGHTVQRLRFRERYGGLVVALWRNGERLYDRSGGQPLQEGDEILALGDRGEVEELAANREFDLVAIGPPTLKRLEESVFQLRLTPGSELAGRSVRESRVGELTGLTIVGRIPMRGRLVAVGADTVFEEGDVLLVSGEPERVAGLLQFGDIELHEREEPADIESESIKVAEVIIAPRSSIEGRTLRSLDFRERYGLQVLALMRAGDPIHEGLADLPLRVGDSLLLQGPPARLALLSAGDDFLVLTPGYQEVRRTNRAPLTLAAIALMVGLVATGVYPIQVAAFIAAVLLVALGALTMEQAYRAVDWRTVFLVAAVLPLGTAIERSGAAPWIADGVVGLAGGFGPYAVLLALMVLSCLLSQVVTGAPTVVMLAPVAFEAAGRVGASPRPLMMGLALAASITFLTPFSHRANLLVMSAGGYRTKDYLKVGALLTVLALALIAGLVPLLFPFSQPVVAGIMPR
jgi:di/tricarboxylate transporter